MAINFTDFSKAPTTPSPWADVLENALKGYKIGSEPARMKQEAESKKLDADTKRLQNSIHKLALEHAPEEWAMKKEMHQANLNKANRAGTAGIIKPSGDIANKVYIDQQEAALGADNPQVKALKQVFETGQHAKETNSSSKEAYKNSLAFRALPSDEKKRAVAMTTGMGYDPIEAEAALAQGKTLTQLADEKGLKVNDVIPIYPVGGENIKQAQRRGAFVQELSVLDKHVAEGLGKYQNKVLGFSPKQIVDAIKNDDPEKQGKVLAARALAPELASLRLKVAGGNIGIEALREMQDKSLSKLRLFESTISPEAFASMNRYLDKWIMEANDKYSKAINDYGRLNVGKSSSYSDQEMIPAGQPNGDQGGAFNFNDFPVAKRK